MPNGRLLAPGAPLDAYASPIGVSIEQYVNSLTALAISSGFVAPLGADPDADLRAWNARVNLGEPYGPRVRAILGELHRHHSALGVPFDRPAPTLVQSGWTDDLFPIGQGLRMYDALRRGAPGSYVSLQLGDLGHPRGGDHAVDTRRMEHAALAFFDRFLKGRSTAPAPRSGSVVAFGQCCPRDAPRGSGPWRAASYAGLARGAFALRLAAARQRVSSTGGDPALSTALAPLGVNACERFPAHRAPGTAIVLRRSPGVTLLGRPTVRLTARLSGRFAQLDARLWDVSAGRQRLIDRAVARVPASGPVAFRLNGNAWRFARGHTIKLELLGRDGPTFRPSNGRFSVAVRDLRVTLPTLERAAHPRLAG